MKKQLLITFMTLYTSQHITAMESDRPTLLSTNSKSLAQLLIANGAEIPENILDDRFEAYDFPVELVQFYLEKGIRPKYSNLWQLICWQNAPTDKERQKLNLPPATAPWITTPEEQSLLVDAPLAKARLLLERGLSAAHQNHEGFTALHYAAGQQDEGMCRLLLESKTVHQKEFLSFLVCCKRNFPRFYAQKDLLRLLWHDLSPNNLKAIKNNEGKTAWDYWPVDWLKPQ